MKTYFISGHRDATQEEFNIYYKPKILKAISENSKFVVGDCNGIDKMAQIFLKENNINSVTVYHLSTRPMFNAGFKTIGNFNSDHDRDFSMTTNSNEDIVWIRKGKERSGSAYNIDRRIKYNSGELSFKNITQVEGERFL